MNNYKLKLMRIIILFLLLGSNSYAKYKIKVTNNINQASLLFIENKGQIIDDENNIRSDIAYVVESNGVRLYFTKSGITYVFSQSQRDAADRLGNAPLASISDIAKNYSTSKRKKLKTFRMDMQLIGNSPHTRIIAKEEAEGYFNYYYAHCPEGITGVKAYKKLVYKNIYNNIDMVLSCNEKGLKYDFVVKPGGKVQDIRMHYLGIENIQLLQNGKLKAANPLGKVIEGSLKCYQTDTSEDNNHFDFVQNDFKGPNTEYQLKDNDITFTIDHYNSNQILVIEPNLEWATYYGGNGNDICGPVVVDSNGNIAILGYTESTNFPVTSGAYQTSYKGNKDVFIAKFDADGNRLWSTYYGGNDDDLGIGMTFDNANNILVTGTSHSNDFPVSNDAFQTNHKGYGDVCILKFTGSGTRVWATLYGGNDGYEYGQGIETDDLRNVYISGVTYSDAFPVTDGAFQTSRAGGADDFIVKFNSSGARQWATYFGGSAQEINRGMGIDANNNLIIAGRTYSSDIPVTNSAFQKSNGGGADVYIAKFTNNGTLQWATYCGGSSYDDAGPFVDKNGSIYISGSTQSTDLPITNDAFQTNYAGGQDAFWAKFNSNGNRSYCTFYGGSDEDWGRPITTDNEGNVIFVGDSKSTDLPGMNGAIQSYNAGKYDIFIAKFTITNALQWATYYGGSDTEAGLGVTSDNLGNILVSGWTKSSDFPFSNNAFQTNNNGGTDAVVIKITGEQTSNGIITPIVPDHSLHEEFYVDIQVKDVTNLFGVSFKLNFPKNLIEVISTEKGTFLGNDVIYYDNIDNGLGTVSVGISRKGNQSGSNGIGVVARIKLKEKPSVINGTPITLSLNEVSANDPSGNTISLTPQEASYIASPGPQGQGTITPIINDHKLHKEFYVDIQTTEVTNLFGASFKLNFPANQLQVISSERGGFLGSDIIYYDNIDSSNGNVSIGISKKGNQSGSNGTGIIAKIKMKEKSSVYSGTQIALSLSEISANDPSGNAIILTPRETSYITLVKSPQNQVPKEMTLYQNYPNPFNPITTIPYTLLKTSTVQLQIFDLQGRLVRALVNGAQEPGMHSVQWDATNENGERVASGIYICRFKAGNVVKNEKIILAK